MESGDDISGWRTTIFRLVLLGLAGWTVWTLGTGWMTVHAVASDDSGRSAWSVYSLVMGTGGGFSEFYQHWSQPAERASFVTNFEGSFWQARLQLWIIPTVALGIVGLLVKPR